MTEDNKKYRNSNICRSSLLLYAVTDRRWLNGKSLKNAVKEALDGGVTCIQLREKDKNALTGCGSDELLEEVREIKAVCADYNVPFIIDDDVELCKNIDADGVHLGQSDMDPVRARKILGPGKIIGVSAHNPQEALIAEAKGADYLGCGAAFATDSKNNAKNISHETLKRITETVHIPVIAIGGINADNISKLKSTGIAGVAVISAIFAANDIKKAASQLLKESERYFH